jgi:hypothetical protein
MLADGPWYTSAVTTLTVALVVLAVLTLAVTVYLWRVGPPRKRIVYSMPVATSLLSSRVHLPSGMITISYKDEDGYVSVPDPYLVNLHVESKSRRDISAKEFNADKPLVFDLGTRIFATVGESSSTRTVTLPDATLTIGESTVELSPCLIHNGTVLSLDLLLSGPPELTHSSPLIDVDVLQGGDNEVFGWKQGVGCLGALAVCGGLFVALTVFGASFGLNFYKTHSYVSYKNYVQRWSHIELIVGVIALIVIALGVVVAVLLSQHRARVDQQNRAARIQRPALIVPPPPPTRSTDLADDGGQGPPPAG